jgi:hypothetical protein
MTPVARNEQRALDGHDTERAGIIDHADAWRANLSVEAVGPLGAAAIKMATTTDDGLL